jgi:hypothetical protein
MDPATAGDDTLYDFVTHDHERGHPYAAKATVTGTQIVTAILDSQQRLTALNVAIHRAEEVFVVEQHRCVPA